MAALPKKKMSMGRKGNRRSQIKAKVPALVTCPQCRLPKRSHQACPSCGFYHGRTAIVVESANRRPA